MATIQMTFRKISKKGEKKLDKEKWEEGVDSISAHFTVTHQIISSITACHYQPIFLYQVVIFPHHPLGSLDLECSTFFSKESICCHLIGENVTEQ